MPVRGVCLSVPINPSTAKAKDMIFTARKVGAVEAEKIGLCDQVAPAGEAKEAALALGRSMLKQGPVALRMAKAAIDQGMQVDVATAMRIEEACYAQTIPTKDRMEGLNAFKEKRKPVYTGE